MVSTWVSELGFMKKLMKSCYLLAIQLGWLHPSFRTTSRLTYQSPCKHNKIK